MTKPSSKPEYRELVRRWVDTATLGSSAAILSWDQETMMPKGGVELRSKQLSQLASLTHEMATQTAVGDLLRECENDDDLVADPASDTAANLREARRSFDRMVKLPAALVAELAETESLAQHQWAEARSESDFARFQPWLEKLLALCKRKAECLGAPAGGELWDALAEGFEPGARAKDLQQVFTPLARELRELIADLRDNGTPPDSRFHRQALPIDRQEAFVRFVSEAMGFDFDRGRMDRSTHPFCGGAHPGDVRITTRFHDDMLIDALGSTMHESGHALYEQGLPVAHWGTPLGNAVSLGIHESQSRLWENHVGRSAAFWDWCRPHMDRFFGTETMASYEAGELYRCSNVVEPSLIRVEADEATYDLHVLIRFELELALLRDELEVADLPAAWNDKYRHYLGIDVPDDRRGCLQDVHWSMGAFGYFPTYTLGNLYAAQLFAKAKQELELDPQIRNGEFGALRDWLRERVHSEGSRFPAGELCARVTGAPLGSEAMLSHLRTKLRPIYGLS